MPPEPRWRRYLRFHRPDHLRDLDDELRDHLQSTTDDLIARGLSPRDANAEARRRLGDLQHVRAAVAHIDHRAARSGARAAWIDGVWKDVVYAIRQLRRAPLFTAVATSSIGLGIALNVTIFSVANGLLLRPLPGVRADGLQRVYVNHHSAFQWQDFAWVRERATLLESMVGERMVSMSMEAGDSPERVVGALASHGFFQTLGVRMALGRAFNVDERQTGDAVAVLSYGTWQSRFGGDSAIVGRTLRLAGHPFTIVGVTAPDFMGSMFGMAPALWIPLASTPAILGASLDDAGGSLYAIGRLRDPTQRGAAAAQLAALAQQRYAMDTTRFQQFTLRFDHVRGVNAELRAPLLVATGFLMIMVVIVLLIACANIANLLLGRASARRTEIGVRLALGAGHARLLRQLLIESLLLAFLGTGLGVAAAFAMVGGIARMLPTDAGVLFDLAPDRRVFAFAALLLIGSSLLFGLAPALRAISPSLTTLLRADADAAHGRRSRMRGTLVGGQVALCVVLLAVAALLSRSFLRSRAVDSGVVAAGVLDVQLDVGRQRSSADGSALFVRLVDRLAALPGVQSVALADIAPLAGSNSETSVLPEGMSAGSRATTPHTYFNTVGPAYFSTVRLPIARGREFLATDGPGAPDVVIINETAARRWWPDGDAIGKHLRWGGAAGGPLEVVGIARDAKYNSYGEDPTPFVYLPFAQHYQSQMIAHVRASGRSLTAAALRDAVRETDPTLPPPTVKPLADEMALALLPARLGALLLGVFGAVALLIAASGIYGVTSYAVSRRTREIGIRSALGASRSMVMRLIVTEGMRTVAIGAGVGLVLAIAIGVVLSHALYGISAFDPAMLLGVPALLSLVAVLACWIPARRAARVDPVTAMRAE